MPACGSGASTGNPYAACTTDRIDRIPIKNGICCDLSVAGGLLNPVMKTHKVIFLSAAALVVLGASVCLYAAFAINQAALGRLFSTVEAVPKTSVALVLGCSPTLSSGQSNLFFENRMQAAALLWKSGKCRRLLVSGDNHIQSYDEPTAMLRRLTQLGVPEEVVVLDYAGFSTFDSMARARHVFGLDRVCVVTQADHAKRALFLAERLGIEAIAYEAKEVGFRDGLRTQLREVLARARAILDVGVLQRKPHFLGPRIQITKTPIPHEGA